MKFEPSCCLLAKRKKNIIDVHMKYQLFILSIFTIICMQGHAQSNNAAMRKLSDSDTVSTLKPWYIPTEYPRYDLLSETWDGSYLEFAANNKYRLVKRHTSGRNFLFVTGDYLFDYSKKLLYLKFTDSVSLESYEMVFDVEYCKEKWKWKKIKRDYKGGLMPGTKIWTLISYKKIPRLPIRARKNLRNWNGTLNMNRYVGATWDMPIAEILNCETVESGIVRVQSDR